MSLRRPLLAAVLLGLAPAAPVAAQTGPDSLPRELVVALLESYGFQAAPQLLVGRAPPQLPAGVLPPDAVVLGSALHGARSLVVVVTGHAPPAVQDTVERRLRERGWGPPYRPPSRHGGMMSSGLGAQDGYCKDGLHLVPTAESWSRGRTLLRIQLTHAGNSPCSATPRGPMGIPGLPVVPRAAAPSMLPVLRPPPGARVEVVSAGGYGDAWSARSRIEGRLGMATLLRHYDGEMRGAGWDPVDEALGTAIAAGLWRRQGAEGRRWLATMTVTRASDAPADAIARYSADLRVEAERNP